MSDLQPLPPLWAGRAVIRSGWALFTGTAGDHISHRHHAVQLAIGLQGPAELWAENPGTLAAPAILVPADCPHRLVVGPEPLLLLYVERESVHGRLLDHWCAGRARALDRKHTAKLTALLDSDAVSHHVLEGVVKVILDKAVPACAFTDERVASSLASLPRPLPKTISVHSLARSAGVSPGRYSHLFRAHTGMALRPYLRWLRLHQALTEIARGTTLTNAAYAAGFADSAHLSRTFRQTFGVAPRVLLGRHFSIDVR